MMSFADAVVRFFIILIILIPNISHSQNFSDTLHVLAVRAQFQPDNAENTTGDGTFDLSVSNDPYQIDPPPHNRSYFADHLVYAKNYFAKVSRNQFLIAGKVFPLGQNDVYQLDNPMTHYNPNTTPEAINTGLAELFRDAILKADEDSDVNFADYDSFVVFHAGVGKDIDFGFDSTPQDIPSLFITQDFLQTYLGIDGIPVDGGATMVTEGMILPETESQEGIQLGLNGMLVSNFGTQIGWVDLFSPVTRRSGVGRFSVMDAGLFNGDGLLPALPDAWTRISGGWENAQPVFQAQDDEFQVYHVLSKEVNRVYKFPINQREYFLVENRYAGGKTPEAVQAVKINQRNALVSMREILTKYFPEAVTFSDSTGVLVDVDNPDRGLPGGLVVAENDTILPGGKSYAAGDTIWISGGVLIWHIDENVIDQNRNGDGINADTDHRGVDVEEADGSQDIGQVIDFLSGAAGSELGTPLDLWFADNPAPLFIEKPRNEFSINSIPNSRSYYNRANSHISLSKFSASDSVMTFTANINFYQQHFPVRFDTAKYGKVLSLKTTDLDQDGGQDLILTTSHNEIYAMDDNGSGAWGDSLRIAGVFGEMVYPPAIYTLPDGTKGIVALTRKGCINLFEFDLGLRPAVRLILNNFQCPDSITTFPIVEYDWLNGGAFPDVVELDSLPKVYWGCKDGNVYEMKYENGSWQPPSVLVSIGEPVAKLQFSDPNTAVIISRNGIVYQNDARVGEVTGKIFQPVGYNPLTVNSDGFFFELLGQQYEHPEEGIFQFDAAPVAISTGIDPYSTRYVIAGENHVNVFNYNLTMLQNYWVRIFNPEEPLKLSLSPLVGSFPTELANSDL
ncbi:MAG: hypothetical protein ACE5GL_02750, partial [Calditrichia bacterium]